MPYRFEYDLDPVVTGPDFIERWKKRWDEKRRASRQISPPPTPTAPSLPPSRGNSFRQLDGDQRGHLIERTIRCIEDVLKSSHGWNKWDQAIQELLSLLRENAFLSGVELVQTNMMPLIRQIVNTSAIMTFRGRSETSLVRRHLKYVADFMEACPFMHDSTWWVHAFEHESVQDFERYCVACVQRQVLSKGPELIDNRYGLLNALVEAFHYAWENPSENKKKAMKFASEMQKIAENLQSGKFSFINNTDFDDLRGTKWFKEYQDWSKYVSDFEILSMSLNGNTRFMA